MQEFSYRGTPLGKYCFEDLVGFFIKDLDPKRVAEMQFVAGRRGWRFVRCFLKRHPEISFKRRGGLEQQRAEALEAVSLAKHFA